MDCCVPTTSASASETTVDENRLDWMSNGRVFLPLKIEICLET